MRKHWNAGCASTRTREILTILEKMMNAPEMLPCPFCGGPAEYDACDRLINIGCTPCGYKRYFPGILQTNESPVRVSDLEFYHQHAGIEAKRAWNQRANPPKAKP